MTGFLERLRPHPKDWSASLVVFLVALPLSLGIALASGAPPAAAIITAILGGIVVGSMTGAPLSVSGPAAGLCTLVFDIVQRHGFTGLLVATLIGGVIQIAMGLVRLGKVFAKAPEALLEGMLSAIGLIILLAQVHVMLGFKAPSSPVLSVQSFPDALLRALSDQQGWVHAPALLVGLVAMITQISWPRLLPRFSWIPGALPAVLIATPLSLLFEVPRVSLESLGGHMGASLGALFGLSWTTQLPALVLAGVTVALVASAESLLTGRAVQSLARRRGDAPKESVDYDQELYSQGVGNVLSGLAGGIPMTSVIVRGAVNVNADARTRASSMLHGLWIAVFVLAIPSLVRVIPLSALAAILVLTGFKLLNLGGLKRAWTHDWREGAVWTLTLGSILLTSLLTGLIIGLAGWAVIRLASPAPKAKQAH